MTEEAIAFYSFLCTSMIIGLSAITSMRLVFVAMRGSQSEPEGPYLVAGVIGAILAYFGASAALEFSGLVGGIAAIFASVPFMSIFWLTLLGGMRIIERIFTGLVKAF